MRKYTKEQFINAVSSSKSIAETLEKLNLKPCGGNYKSFHKYVQELNLDISHMSGQTWNKGQIIGPKRPLEDYLSNKQSITSHKLKLRLIQESIFDAQCNCCKQKHWLSKTIPLELHHIDGNHHNNELSNLQLLCPNCHALTLNYRGKAKKSKI